MQYFNIFTLRASCGHTRTRVGVQNLAALTSFKTM